MRLLSETGFACVSLQALLPSIILLLNKAIIGFKQALVIGLSSIKNSLTTTVEFVTSR